MESKLSNCKVFDVQYILAYYLRLNRSNLQKSRCVRRNEIVTSDCGQRQTIWPLENGLGSIPIFANKNSIHTSISLLNVEIRVLIIFILTKTNGKV